MARTRNIKPTFFHDAELLECDFWVRLLFQGLWCYADRRGILAENIKQIKLDVFPGDSVDIAAGLEQLEERGFIRRYVVSNRPCIVIRTFAKHQNPHKDEKPNDLPAPDEADEEIRVVTPENADTGQTPGKHRTDRAVTTTVTTTVTNHGSPTTVSKNGTAPAALNRVRYSSVFDQFWEAWQVAPSKNHGAKKEAYDAWKALGLDARNAEAERQEVVEGLLRWQACGRWMDGYVKDCHRWLKARMFADEPPPEPSRKEAGKPAYRSQADLNAGGRGVPSW